MAAGGLQTSQAQGSALTVHLNQQLLPVVNAQHLRALLGQGRTVDQQSADAGSHHQRLQEAVLSGAGSLRLLSQANNTSSEEHHRQACMPPDAVRPSMNTAPESRVPTNRPAALAIIEGFHIFNHKQNCKTKAEWMEQSGMTYDRESEVN